MQFTMSATTPAMSSERPIRPYERAIFVIVGALFLFFSVYLGKESFQIATSGVTAQAEIVDVVRRSGSHNDTFAPVYKFTAADGQSYTVTSRISGSSMPTVGTKTQVIYMPTDPQGARENSFFDLWLFPVVFLAFGGIAIVAGLMAKTVRVRQSGPALSSLLTTINTVASAPAASQAPLSHDLTTYVNSARAQNIDRAAIRKALVDAGWNPNDVDRALS